MASKSQIDISHNENEMAKTEDNIITEQSRLSVQDAKAISLRQSFKVYPKAVMWSVFLSTALIMEGYDVVSINSFFGQSNFQDRFGVSDGRGGKVIPTNWQAALNNAASIGQVIGLVVNGYSTTLYGAKRTYIASMAVMIATIFIPVFAVSLPMLFAGQILCGIPWGVFQTLTTAYAAEICPLALRGYLTSYNSMCWGIGLSLGAGVVRASLGIPGDWAWRMPYMVQWVWPVPLLIGALFAPESPWWLVKNGRTSDATNVLRRLTNPAYVSDREIDAQIEVMHHTIELERKETQGAGLRDCFRGSNARRTEIACFVWLIQSWCGQPITAFATLFLQNAGMSQTMAFNINLIGYLMFIVGTIIAWTCLYRFGRRRMYIASQVLMGILFGIIGVLGCLDNANSGSISTAIGVCMILITFAFNISVGPACYTLVAEIPSSRLRPQTIVIARLCYVVSGIFWGQIYPRFVNEPPQGWGVGGKFGFLFLGTNALLVLYCYLRLPETMGKTFGELDVLFVHKVPARKFRHAVVDEFSDSITYGEAIESR